MMRHSLSSNIEQFGNEVRHDSGRCLKKCFNCKYFLPSFKVFPNKRNVSSIPIRSNPIRGYLYKHIQRTHLREKEKLLAKDDSRWNLKVNKPKTEPPQKKKELTKLNPKIILHQNSTLFNSVRFRTHGSLCTMTIGICIIIMKNPYPLNFLVMHPMTSSCASELITNVVTVANGRLIVAREAE